MNSLQRLLGSLLPGGGKCAYCNVEIPRESTVCAKCGAEAESLKNTDGMNRGILHAYEYAGAVRKIIQSFKYGDMPRKSFFIAQKMAEFLDGFEVAADAVTFVPIHKNRFKERGFDQSEMLANHLSALLSLPCISALERIRDTKPQYKLGLKERKQNISGAFSLNPNIDIQDKNLLLIDDIYTTGATCGECFKLLSNAGANVYIFTYSRELPK